MAENPPSEGVDVSPSFDVEFNWFSTEGKLASQTKRFPSLSKKELDKIVSERHSEKTKKTTSWAVSTFEVWSGEKKIKTPLESMTIGQLDQNLRRFYAEARAKNGENYSKSTLLGFRHAIERYLNVPPYNRSLRLAHDPRFARSNQMLDAQLIQLKRSGKENTKHKPAIEVEDLRKLKTSQVFSFAAPMSLLRCVWFNVVLYFCRRGREGQRSLSSTSFKMEVDVNGRKFATMAHDEASKNHPGGLKDVNSSEKEARMYETEEQNDGFKALKLYLAKINPDSTAFFQYPKKNWKYDDQVWYEARPVGVNTLANMMKVISQEATLSRSYTNHSVRATAITLLVRRWGR